MFKAIRVLKYGGPEVLTLSELPRMTPKAGQVWILFPFHFLGSGQREGCWRESRGCVHERGLALEQQALPIHSRTWFCRHCVESRWGSDKLQGTYYRIMDWCVGGWSRVFCRLSLRVLRHRSSFQWESGMVLDLCSNLSCTIFLRTSRCRRELPLVPPTSLPISMYW